jgi:phosphodiesterase/alkaline phosphatase D-like protein
MSTVPTAMIFDDHDVRDDWNTSGVWRAEMSEKPWWRERIRAALASYWVYQHIGNLPAGELAADEDYRKITAHAGDTWPLLVELVELVELADRADAEVDGNKGVRFSHRWDLGATRLVMIDSRNGRILDHGAHLMLGETEFTWVEEHAAPDDGVDHLVLGTSVPWLLPHAISDLQGINEVAAARPGWRGRLAERIRRAADLEHWAAFGESFARLTRLVSRAAAAGPATVTVLSGDVHHSYAARATFARGGVAAPVHQLTCSPVHNHLPALFKPGLGLGWSPLMGRLTEAWARRAGVTESEMTWKKVAGPMFGNIIATLDLDGRAATAVFEQPTSAAALIELARLELAGAPSSVAAVGKTS